MFALEGLSSYDTRMTPGKLSEIKKENIQIMKAHEGRWEFFQKILAVDDAAWVIDHRDDLDRVPIWRLHKMYKEGRFTFNEKDE
jgi:hypothetical protein